MSKLEQLIQELCPDGVEYKKTLEIVNDSFWIMPSTPNYIIEKEIPYITSKNIKNGEINFNNIKYITKEDFKSISNNREILENDFLISMIGTLGENAIVKKSDLDFYGQNMFLLRLNFNIMDLKFFYHYFNSPKIKHYLYSIKNNSSQGYLKANHIQDILIPIPPLPIQEEIVRILDTFNETQTELINQLQTELTARKQQYEYCRDSLLTFGDDVELKPLDKIKTEMYRGSGIKRDQITAEGIPCVRYGEIYTTYNICFDECVSHTIEANIPNRKYFGHGDVLFAITGESIEDIAKSCVYLGQEKCLAGGDTVVMKHNENPKFLSYALSTNDAKNQKGKGKVKSKVVHSSVPALKEIKIPIPPIPEQERIVTILDNLDNQVTEITQKLSEEIKARKQQYEYYRDKLLTFKEL